MRRSFSSVIYRASLRRPMTLRQQSNATHGKPHRASFKINSLLLLLLKDKMGGIRGTQGREAEERKLLGKRLLQRSRHKWQLKCTIKNTTMGWTAFVLGYEPMYWCDQHVNEPSSSIKCVNLSSPITIKYQTDTTWLHVEELPLKHLLGFRHLLIWLLINL